MSIPGTKIAEQYVLEELLNDSELVEVWRATRLKDEGTVLLKLLAKQLAEQPEAVTRFRQQYETLRELGGKHVVVPIDVGQCPDGRLYLVTEFLKGQTLKERMEKRGPLPVAEVVDFFGQACLGLQDAHVRNIVHRDIKPSNLFLVTESEGKHAIKIIDFEMAKTRDVKITREGQALGSAMYMPPEQMRSASAVTPNADIWALGVSMYYLATGKYPFEGKSITALAMAIMNDDPVPLGSRDPNLPKEFVEIVQRCLSRKPTDRYGTGGQLRQVLLGLSNSAAPVVPALQGAVATAEKPRDPQLESWLGAGPSNPFHPSSHKVSPTLQRSGAALSSAGSAARPSSSKASNVARPLESASDSGWTFWAFALPITLALLLAVAFWWFVL
jgi:eukaryotic-like serine/threonine-protein kinase